MRKMSENNMRVADGGWYYVRLCRRSGGSFFNKYSGNNKSRASTVFGQYYNSSTYYCYFYDTSTGYYRSNF